MKRALIALASLIVASGLLYVGVQNLSAKKKCQNIKDPKKYQECLKNPELYFLSGSGSTTSSTATSTGNLSDGQNSPSFIQAVLDRLFKVNRGEGDALEYSPAKYPNSNFKTDSCAWAKADLDQYNCYTDLARTNSEKSHSPDTASCRMINASDYRDHCLETIAEVTDYVSPCTIISDSDTQFDCVTAVALDKKDVATCYYLSTGDSTGNPQSDCIASVKCSIKYPPGTPNEDSLHHACFEELTSGQ